MSPVQSCTLGVMSLDKDASKATRYNLRRKAQAFHTADTKRQAAREEVRAAVRQAHAEGMTEAAMAEACGVTRMTVRAWLGKSVGQRPRRSVGVLES
jgi:DNA invertase Pin-like site-specific DNA recombinase